jgi:2-keto-4-pentenoate hydratase
VLDRVADCMSNGAFVQGRAIPAWRTIDLSSLDVELRLDGNAIVRRTGGHVAKDPLLPAIALVNDLRAAAGVRAGRIITTGTYTGLNFARPGQAVEAVFHGIGSVNVRFEGAA